MEQNIVWFDISVHNIVFLEYFEGLENLFEKDKSLRLAKPPLSL